MASPSAVAPTAVPDALDLRDYLWPVENVGEVPAAAAAAASAALEYHCNRMGERPTNLSTLFVHYNARRLSGTEGSNTGTSMDAVMKAVATFGACREETWPFAAGAGTQRPSAAAYEEGKRFSAIRTGHPLDLLESLALHYPTSVVARIPVRCLDEAGRSAVFPSLSAEERQRPDHPVHAFLLVGYDKRDRTYLARNCWGDRWGDRGYCRIAFDVLHGIAAPGSAAYWYIATSTAADAPTIAPAAMTPAASTAVPAAETLADMAARMRAEIRGDVDRDLADASRRIRERMAIPGHGTPTPPAARSCTFCNGAKTCWACRGAGCATCGRSGQCTACA
jgi:hypothetical protein